MTFIERLLKHEAAAGIALMLAALAALVVANSGLQPAYDAFLGAKLSVLLNDTGLEKPLILWINDGLMAVFFFLIGLELKREMLEGKLKNPRDVLLPGLAAVGGMALPAAIFAALNWGEPTLRGWAIPAATDIAFALGILALVGTRAPVSLKVFLLTLAILDDLGAILIIALFYTADLQVKYLAMALVPLAGLLALNLTRAGRHAPYILLGTILWVLVLKSGVHATLAGVVTAFLVPLTDRNRKSPLHDMETALTPYVNFLILPLFAFANAGVVFQGMALSDLLAPLPLGIAAGLVAGKLGGVFGVTWALVRSGAANLPEGAGWMHILGVACLAGIGFTMSLFIGGLSFASLEQANQVKLGVLSGSLVSAIAGFAILRFAAAPDRTDRAAPQAEAA